MQQRDDGARGDGEALGQRREDGGDAGGEGDEGGAGARGGLVSVFDEGAEGADLGARGGESVDNAGVGLAAYE